MKITKKNLEKVIIEEIDALLAESKISLPLPRDFDDLLKKIPALRKAMEKMPVAGKLFGQNAVFQVLKQAYTQKSVVGVLEALAKEGISLIPIISGIITTYQLSQATIKQMEKYKEYEKGIKNTLKPSEPLRSNDLEDAGVDTDYVKRLKLTLRSRK